MDAPAGGIRKGGAGMNDPHVKTGVRFGEDLLDRDRSWQDLQAPRRQLPGPRPRLLTGRIEYAELSAVSFSNEGGVATGVQLPLRKRERRRATPETRENRGQCKGKRSSRRDRENQRAFEAPPSAQKRFGPGPRISMQASGNHQCAASNRPDTRQRLTRRLELDKEKNPCRWGRPHTKALTIP